ncbi:MAG TPA: regulatory protein RecX [Clostridiales bacterium]|nr:regulatory protein RecX [Clostridiales bacterium]
MTITSITRNEKDKSVYDVHIDNAYSFSVSEEDYFRLNLYEKREISEEELKLIKKTVSFALAKTKALGYLSFKIRTAREVEDKLIKEGFSEDLTGNVVNDLKADGYINDMLYVRKYIYDRNKLKPKAKRMLAYELKKKGIDDDTIADGLTELKIDNILVAKELICKKFRGCDLSDVKIKHKVFQFLRYRGFSESEIKKAINEANNEMNEMND